MWYEQLTETFVTEFRLVPLFYAVSDVDYDSAFSASASFRWLLLVSSGGLDRFVLIDSPFASITALCGPLR
jgi:hypothetical protein